MDGRGSTWCGRCPLQLLQPQLPFGPASSTSSPATLHTPATTTDGRAQSWLRGCRAHALLSYYPQQPHEYHGWALKVRLTGVGLCRMAGGRCKEGLHHTPLGFMRWSWARDSLLGTSPLLAGRNPGLNTGTPLFVSVLQQEELKCMSQKSIIFKANNSGIWYIHSVVQPPLSCSEYFHYPLKKTSHSLCSHTPQPSPLSPWQPPHFVLSLWLYQFWTFHFHWNLVIYDLSCPVFFHFGCFGDSILCLHICT